jgi:murein DD-endopeptidase MepM/ murein hydrolase activator NlpD
VPLPLVALIAGFAAGVLVDGWLRTYGPPKPVQVTETPIGPPAQPVVAAAKPPAASASPAAGAPPDTHVVGTPPDAVIRAPSPDLRAPIDGMNIDSMKGGFTEVRGTRAHEAVDILMPRGTPIHAVSDGTIAKLFFSKAGGITIYEFDADERLCYYYAHLERYVDGLHEGQHVAKGEVIGYVGTSGNAPPNTPHLHFAIFELNADRRWWQGRPLDPYMVFKQRGE